MNRLDIDSSLTKGRWADRRKTISRASTRSDRGEPVKTGFLSTGGKLPFMIQPQVEGIGLLSWVQSNMRFIEEKLNEHGGILFRGFGLETQSEFESFLSALSLDVMNYIEGATPRTKLSDKVYTSTEYPADQSIALHNELTY